jgi:hypothetical protein
VTERTLEMWVIYDHPTDLPNHYVARLWCVTEPGGGLIPTALALVCPDLDQLRGEMESLGLTCIPRASADEPQIVEAWI